MLASMLASETHGLHRAVVGGARAHASPTHDAEMHSITQYDQNPRSHIHMCPCPDEPDVPRPRTSHDPRDGETPDAASLRPLAKAQACGAQAGGADIESCAPRAVVSRQTLVTGGAVPVAGRCVVGR